MSDPQPSARQTDRWLEPGPTNVQVVYILYLAGLVIGISGIVGIVLAYVNRGKAGGFAFDRAAEHENIDELQCILLAKEADQLGALLVHALDEFYVLQSLAAAVGDPAPLPPDPGGESAPV